MYRDSDNVRHKYINRHSKKFHTILLYDIYNNSNNINF